jgi:hypothetical protein
VEFAGGDRQENGTTRGVSCSSKSFCVAVDAEGHALTFDGDDWHTTSGELHSTMVSVSCHSAKFCMAVTGNSLTYRFDGRQWGDEGETGSSQLRV